MSWLAVDTIPFRVATQMAPARAQAICDALLRRAVPLARLREGRLEPLATASLVADAGKVALLTASHVFEQASIGDLAVPLPREHRVALLRHARLRVFEHPQLDLALLWIGEPGVAQRLCANWSASPLRHWGTTPAPSTTYALAGYPAANARRYDGRVYIKPVVLFTSQIGAGHYAYARTAQRIDGFEIHTPELDGVSGATLWAVDESSGSDGVACVLRPAAVQVAFRHGRHLRAEPISGATELLLAASDP
jgi:hypothetical protein